LLESYIADMWDVEFVDEFGAWWEGLTDAEQESIDFGVQLLMQYGPTLKFPHSSGVEGSRHTHMRELRVQHQGRPYRVLYAFDPRRSAILLFGGDKTGDDRWYVESIPIADHRYDAHLETLELEGLLPKKD
jgi:hypothetical protein